MSKKLAISILVLITLAACSSSNKQKPEHYFVTHIEQDGTKLFSMTMVSKQNRGNKTRGDKSRRDRSQEGKSRDKRQGSSGSKPNKSPDTIAILERYLDKENFCQLGYEITDNYRPEGKIIVRGKCNDKQKNEPVNAN